MACSASAVVRYTTKIEWSTMFMMVLWYSRDSIYIFSVNLDRHVVISSTSFVRKESEW